MRSLAPLLVGLFLLALCSSCGSQEENGTGKEKSKKAGVALNKAKGGKGTRKKTGSGQRGTRQKFSVLSLEEIKKLNQKVGALPPEPVEIDEVAVVETDLGDIVVKFFTGLAPNTCANFKKLANAGYYEGVQFHRSIPSIMIQTGCILTRDDNPKNDGKGSPGYTIKGELNRRKHRPGRLSMAHMGDPDSAGSQFFICLTRSETKEFDGKHTVFGEVIKGMEVVNKIAALRRDRRNRPIKPPAVIKVYFRKRKEGEEKKGEEE